MKSVSYNKSVAIITAIIMAATVFTIPVFAQSSVDADAGTKAQPYKNTIKVKNKSIMVGKTLTFTAAGDRQNATGSVEGETKFIPYKWELDGKRDYEGYFSYGNYKKSIKLSKPDKYDLEVEFKQYIFTSGQWVMMRDDDYDDDKEVKIYVKGKIKYNVNKGKKISKKSKTVTPGKTYGKLPTPKRTGYTFKGWYTKKSGGTKITAGKKVSLSKKTTTLYARWQKKGQSSGVTLNSDGYIGKAKAKQIALSRTNGGTVTKCKFEWDDGIPQYEIEIWKGNWEYDLDIHAKTGRIIDFDKDYEDDDD